MGRETEKGCGRFERGRRMVEARAKLESELMDGGRDLEGRDCLIHRCVLVGEDFGRVRSVTNVRRKCVTFSELYL